MSLTPPADEVEPPNHRPPSAANSILHAVDDVPTATIPSEITPLPNISRKTKRIAFGIMFVTASTTFVLYLAISEKEHSPRAIDGVWPRYVMYSSLGLFTLAAFITSGITFHYFSPERPFWDLLPLFTIIGMVGFFTAYLHFEPTDIHFWGPLAADLGVVISVGFETIYYSADRNFLLNAWNYMFDGNAGARDEEELELLGRDGRPASND